MEARTLRWPTESALARCTQQIAAACTAWAQAWTGHRHEVDVRTGPPRLPGLTPRSLALPSGERVTLAGADLSALFMPSPRAGFAAEPEGPSLTDAVCQASETDLLSRLFTAVVEAAQSASETPTPESLTYAGDTDFEARLGPLRLQVQVSGAALAHLAPPPPRTLKPQPLDAAAVRRLATLSTVRGRLQLGGLSVPLSALMHAHVGDVIVLDRPLDAPFEWHIDALGLRMPAQLVRTVDSLAVELL